MYGFSSIVQYRCEKQEMFRSDNPEIPDDFYGKWIEILKNTSMKKPNEKDFNLPTNRDEFEQMIAIMNSCGIDRATGITMLKERKSKFDLATKD